MSMRFLVSSLAILAYPALDSRAQDHLLPERGVLNEQLGLDYLKSVRDVLLKDSAPHYRARVVVIPTFQMHWAVTLTYEGDDPPAYFVEYVVSEGKRSPNEAGVRKIKAPIDREAAEAVQQVWFRMLREVHYPEKAVGGQADGVTYHFSRFVPYLSEDPKAPPGWEAGQIWTPDPASMPGRLVALSEALRAYASARHKERARLQESISKQANDLLSDLEKRRKSR